MVENFAYQISLWFLDKNYIDKDSVEDMRFALEVVITNTISFLSIVVIGILIKQWVNTILFIIVFIGFRMLRNRYHAETFLKCYFLAVGSYLLCLGVTYIILPYYQTLFLGYTSGLNMMLLVLFEGIDCQNLIGQINDKYIVVFITYTVTCFLASLFVHSSHLVMLSILGTIIVISLTLKKSKSTD